MSCVNVCISKGLKILIPIYIYDKEVVEVQVRHIVKVHFQRGIFCEQHHWCPISQHPFREQNRKKAPKKNKRVIDNVIINVFFPFIQATSPFIKSQQSCSSSATQIERAEYSSIPQAEKGPTSEVCQGWI